MTLLITPAPEGVDDRFAVRAAVGEFPLTDERALANDLLVTVERADQCERLANSVGMGKVGP